MTGMNDLAEKFAHNVQHKGFAAQDVETDGQRPIDRPTARRKITTDPYVIHIYI